MKEHHHIHSKGQIPPVSFLIPSFLTSSVTFEDANFRRFSSVLSGNFHCLIVASLSLILDISFLLIAVANY